MFSNVMVGINMCDHLVLGSCDFQSLACLSKHHICHLFFSEPAKHGDSRIVGDQY